nr:hypothetical protein HK105_005537 [Polyrhizophydium stewartii]
MQPFRPRRPSDPDSRKRDHSTALGSGEPSSLDQRVASHFAGRRRVDSAQLRCTCYLTDQFGVLLPLDSHPWSELRAAAESVGVDMRHFRALPPEYSGRSILEYITGQEVQRFYRRLLQNLASSNQPHMAFEWFCDAPDVERHMCLSVKALTTSSGQKRYLWSSRILSEIAQQPAAEYLGARPQGAVQGQREVIRSVCSFCKRILVSRREIQENSLEKMLDSMDWLGHLSIAEPARVGPHGPCIGMRGKVGQQAGSMAGEHAEQVQHVWLTPAEYLQTGLGCNISINHSICEVCYAETQSLLLQTDRRGGR